MNDEEKKNKKLFVSSSLGRYEKTRLARFSHRLSLDEIKNKNPELYKIAREKGTEAPFTSKFLHTNEEGTFTCAVCGNELFKSDAKFDSGTGWPSFDQAIPGSVNEIEDNTLGMNRTEVTCSKCGAHLGHVFNDGPTKTGLRYCMNGICLDLEKPENK